MLSASQNLVFHKLATGVIGFNAHTPTAALARRATSKRRTSTDAAGATSTVTLSTLATTGRPDESVTLNHAVYVDNLP